MNRIKNPILPGFYPDPSICRVGDDYYIACSSFELYPGIPIFHSRDLMHWEQIGNALTMDNDFHVDVTYFAAGVMAPTIRYSNGKFYIINANFNDKGNYIISADDPAGPWSRPVFPDNIPGIDASLFFDADGTCYIIGTGNVWDNGTGVMERGIWAVPYDIDHFKMLGKPVTIFNSGMRNAASPEAPHIYHIGDYYYLVIAEGGTEHYHCVVVARSRDVLGFYEGDPANPVMTHRMMGTRARIANVGHADLIDTPDGKWYAVMLASRTIEGVYKNLGRETCICPVEWENDWPLFSPETGRLEFEYDAPDLPVCGYPARPQSDDFDCEELPLYFVHYGTPYEKYYAVEDSRLKIKCIKQRLVKELEKIDVSAPPKRRYDHFIPFIGRRQEEFDTDISCRMNFTPKGNETAGLALIQAYNHQLHIERAAENSKQVVRCVLYTCEYNGRPYFPDFTAKTRRRVLCTHEYDSESIVLKLKLRGEDFTVLYGPDEYTLTELAKADGRLICTGQVGNMIGTVIGMYASGNGADSENTAEFDWFKMDTASLTG